MKVPQTIDDGFPSVLEDGILRLERAAKLLRRENFVEREPIVFRFVLSLHVQGKIIEQELPDNKQISVGHAS